MLTILLNDFTSFIKVFVTEIVSSVCVYVFYWFISMGNFWFYSPTLIACIHFLTTLGQMWPRLVFLQQAGRGAGKFCEKKVGGEGEAGGEADTVDIGNGPETPKLTPQISPNFLCLAPVWINTLDVWTCSMYEETSLSVRFKDKSKEYPWLNVSKMICSSVCSLSRLNPTASQV